MRVGILGAGRLGRSLVPLLGAVGIEALSWRRGEPVPATEVSWICVGDSAIADVAAIVPRDGRVILHASASAGLDALRPHEERGVLHPLMTFPGPEIGLPPLAGAGAAVAGSPRALAVATELASRLGMVAFPLPGNPAGYHAAATMASGHLGAVFLVAVEAAIAAGVPADRAAALLLPLASESLRRVASAGGGALTGPAARGDEQAMAAHLAAVPDAVRPFYVSGVVEIGRLRRGSVKS